MSGVFVIAKEKDTVENLFPTNLRPISFFFDSESRMIIEPVSGALLEEYLPALNTALAKLGTE